MPIYTGLGASSTLIVGVTKAIYELYGKSISPIALAEEAFHIEREILGLSGGYQDQYIAALGGIQLLEISKELKVMDTTAVVLCKENNIPLRVFNMLKKGSLMSIINGENTGTIIK